ncbi:TolC family protein [Edaphobacter aggregans]|uniref:TolC family protein n=1 Tax=Edaphobacter aggregans TaxID=570835 RepID=UPI00068A361E|nr:TolC family protein [Edaphobacter aggregans]
MISFRVPPKIPLGIIFLVLAPQSLAYAQLAENALTLSSVVEDAGKNYPAIHISQEELKASAARIELARTAYLPRIDAVAQFNRGTRNNVFGSLLPQAIIPPMSGPVIGTNNGGSVWGSATGVLISWQPFDFGVRSANIRAAQAQRDQASAANFRTQLEVETAAADAYLSVLASMQARKAAETAVDNWEILKRTIHALTAVELRPGADESRVDAEKAAASNQVALAQQAVDSSLATLKKFQSATVATLSPQERLLTTIPVTSGDVPFNPTTNPVMAEREAATAENEAQLRSIRRSWAPQFNLEGAAYGRGTGAEIDGGRLPGANGLAPNVGNYVAGINITFSIMDFASIHDKAATQSSMLKAVKANEDLTARSLQEQFEQALAEFRATTTIAQNTPIQVQAARTALDQATARYKAGLAPVDDVAQSERLFVQADIDNALARLNVWRAFLKLQYIRGDLQPFLQEVNR